MHPEGPFVLDDSASVPLTGGVSEPVRLIQKRTFRTVRSSSEGGLEVSHPHQDPHCHDARRAAELGVVPHEGPRPLRDAAT